MLRKLKTSITILVLVSIIFLFFDANIHKEAFSAQYGINPELLTSILVIAEVAFNVGIIIMLKASGILKMSLKQILTFEFKKVNFEFNSFFFGFFLNRIAAAIPWIYVLAVGWGKIPFSLTLLLLVELVIVLIITFSVIEVGKHGISTSNIG